MPILTSDRITLDFIINQRLLQRENLSLTEVEILQRAKLLCLEENIATPQLTIYLSAMVLSWKEKAEDNVVPGAVSAGYLISPSDATAPTLRIFRCRRGPYLDALYDILLSISHTRNLSGTILRLVVDDGNLAHTLENPSMNEGAQFILELLEANGLDLQIVCVENVYVEEMKAIRRAIQKDKELYGS